MSVENERNPVLNRQVPRSRINRKKVVQLSGGELEELLLVDVLKICNKLRTTTEYEALNGVEVIFENEWHNC